MSDLQMKSAAKKDQKNNSVGFALRLENAAGKEMSVQGVFINAVLGANTLESEGLVTDAGVPDVQALLDMVAAGKIKISVYQTGLGAEKEPSGFFG